MALTTAKQATVMFDDALDTFESQSQMLNLVSFEEPDGAEMQNSGNFIWRPVQQHRPDLTGWDLTGQETDIIEEAYPAILGTPSNDLIKQRADNLRDKRFWDRAGKESGKKRASQLNKQIAAAIATQGSMFVRTNATSGYDVVAESQTLPNERQQMTDSRYFMFNDRDELKFGKDLAARQTVQGRPETVWATGQLGNNIAGADVYRGSFLPNLTGGADPATTVTGNQSFAPEGGSVNATTGVVTNVDYRQATIAVAASASYNIGDKVEARNAGVAIKALGLDDKTSTNQAMTFTIVAIPDGTSVTVYPKPIAVDDAALSTLEKAYANVDTTILNGATLNRVNIDALAKTNLFWDKSAVEVIGGNIPANLMAEYDGMKVMSETMPNGLTMYMIYDGDMISLTFRYRIFAWWGITVCAPFNCGTLVTY